MMAINSAKKQAVGDSSSHSETLSRIANYLRKYTPRDELDLDRINFIMAKMDHDSCLRRSRRRRIAYLCGLDCNHSLDLDGDDCDFANTNGENYLHNLINLVDGDFFYDIIQGVEDESGDFTLNEDTIDDLATSFAIQNDGKKRKRRNLIMKVPTESDNAPSTLGRNKDSTTANLCMKAPAINKGDLGKIKRITRAVARDMQTRFIEHHKHSTQDGLESLLCAMIEIEQADGRPVSILEEITRPNKQRKSNRANQQKYTTHVSPESHVAGLLHDERREMSNSIVEGNLISPKSPETKRRRLQQKEDTIMTQLQDDKDEVKKVHSSQLDWKHSLKLKPKSPIRKRVLPTKKSQLKESTRTLTRENIDAIITSWDALHHAYIISDQATTIEPPQRYHSKDMYGIWCSCLINCLQSSARIFARHEFFYSDLDKAWFNENPFHEELVKHGLSLDLKLTRAEWAAVRRNICKKRPRRFSRRFIDEEFEKLNDYRKTVRKIQYDIYKGKKAADECFPYEVLAPPQIGSTVTAYHHKAHLLHRGTVLAHDYETEAYLILFEKKTLGYEWCADFEVASHGPPLVIYGSENKCLGQTVTGQQISSLGLFYPTPECCSRIDCFSEEVKDEMEKRFTEQGHINFMSAMEYLLERKNLLLEKVTSCTTRCKSSTKKSAINFNRSAEESCTKPEETALCLPTQTRLRWLYSNLNTTDKALKMVMDQFKVTHGTSRACNLTLAPNHRDDCDTKLCKDDPTFSPKMLCDITKLALNICGVMSASNVLNDGGKVEDCSIIDNEPCMLSLAGNFLMVLDICVDVYQKYPWTIDTQHIDVVLSVLADSLQNLKPEPILGFRLELEGLLSSRESAFKELKGSITMLLKELHLLMNESSH